MPRRASKVPFSSSRKTDFAFPDSAWDKIEAAYGRTLVSPLRRKVTRATENFVSAASDEKAAATTLAAKRRLARLHNHATKLLYEINKRNSFQPGAPEFYADELIYHHSHHPDKDNKNLAPGRWHKLLEPQAATVAGLIAEYDAAQREMKQTSKPGYWPEGSAWTGWIVGLTEIMKAEDLPTAAAVTVKKDADYYSPFVRLVGALQQLIPNQFRHSVESEDALKQAIKRARYAK